MVSLNGDPCYCDDCDPRSCISAVVTVGAVVGVGVDVVHALVLVELLRP